MTLSPHERLRAAALVYAAGLGIHTLDHLRRGTESISRQVAIAGAVSTFIAVVVIALVLSRHRRAPVVAFATGIPIAFGIVAVHLLPSWGALSDPFVGNAAPGVNVMSWIAVAIETGGALAMGVAGAALVAIEWRHRLSRREATPTR